ncbi:MAG: RNA polymerase sigma factor [Candidatus Aminicenantales bacterium]
MSKRKDIPLEEAVLKYWPQIRFRVRRSLGHHTTEWEDVAGNILLDVITTIRKGKFEGRSSLGTFVYVITTRRIIDFLRAKSRDRKAFPELPEPQQEADPSLFVEKKERERQVFDALKKLNSRQADILYLYYYQELTQKEIAEIFGLSPRRINTIIRNAREALRTILQKSHLRPAGQFSFKKNPTLSKGGLIQVQPGKSSLLR